MAAGVTIKHKRKAGAIVNGELAAGEIGLDTTNSVWYYSGNGTTVAALVGTHTHNATDINAGDLATARMQVNVVAAVQATGGTLSAATLTIDGGTLP